MSLKIMPILIVNIGCEMVYILWQRLQAQDVESQKASRVINDVIQNYFSFNFVEEFMKPQTVYSLSSLKQVFETLAHSSIMRLSEQSFGKLFELMIMGIKYQMLACSDDNELFNVCMRHIRGVNDLLNQIQSEHYSDSLKTLITNVGIKLSAVYGSLTPGEWHQIRMGVLEFLKGKKVKISIFLHEGIQNSNGNIFLPCPDHPCIGLIKYKGNEETNYQQKQLELCQKNLDKTDYFCHPEELGANLYLKDRITVQPPERRSYLKSFSNNEKIVNATGSSEDQEKQQISTQKVTQEVLAEDLISEGLSDGGKVELNMLASMIRPRDFQEQKTKFKLNLFNNDLESHDNEILQDLQLEPTQKKIISEQQNQKSSKNDILNNNNDNSWKQQELVKLVGDLEVDVDQGGSVEKGDDNEDLLDLMDSLI